MKLMRLLAGALLLLSLFDAPVLAKFYLENQTNSTVRLGFVTLRGEQVRGRGWYRLRPGEGMTVEENDFRRNKKYFLVAMDERSGNYLNVGNGMLGSLFPEMCAECWAVYGDTRVYLPGGAYNIGFNNSYVEDALRSNSWTSFLEYEPSARQYPGFFIQPRTNCYDSAKLTITRVDNGWANFSFRVWDRQSSWTVRGC